MTRRRIPLRLLSSRDVIAAINRAGDELLDPHRHGYEEGAESPWAPSMCLRCGRPRDEHWSMLRRALVALLRWRRG